MTVFAVIIKEYHWLVHQPITPLPAVLYGLWRPITEWMTLYVLSHYRRLLRSATEPCVRVESCWNPGNPLRQLARPQSNQPRARGTAFRAVRHLLTLFTSTRLCRGAPSAVWRFTSVGRPSRVRF